MQCKYIITAGHIRIVSVSKFLAKVKACESKYQCIIAVLDAKRICSRTHLESAVEHALRAFAQKRNICETLGAEIIVYAACERQIHNAIEIVGVRRGTSEIAVVILGGRKTRILQSLGIKCNENVLENRRRFDFSLLGLSEQELRTVPTEKRAELVLERVAMMDIMK